MSIIDVRRESTEELDARLRGVLERADVRRLSVPYRFVVVETSMPVFDDSALAYVREDLRWSALMPTTEEESDAFTVFSLRFESGTVVTGFIGWLASRIKSEVGSGLFVVCGLSAKTGSIFDYFAVPMLARDAVVNALKRWNVALT